MRLSFTLKTSLPTPTPAKTAVRSQAARAAAPRWVLLTVLGFLLLSMTGSVFIDAELNGLHHFIFSYLALPILVLCYGVTWLAMTEWRQRTSQLKMICGPGLVAGLLILTCSGAVNYANALLGSGAPVQFSGPITKLTSTSTRTSRNYYLVLSD